MLHAKRLPFWRTGFYHIAVAAQVPLGLAFFNYAKREIGICAFLMPTGDVAADLEQIQAWYAKYGHARHPGKAGPIAFKPAPTK